MTHGTESGLHQLLAGTTAVGVTFDDALDERLAHLVTSGEGSDIDLAVLIRHYLRRGSLRQSGRAYRVEMSADLSRRLRPMMDRVGLREGPAGVWSDVDWWPEWLGPVERKAIEAGAASGPDAAAGAGLLPDDRFADTGVPADLFFTGFTGYTDYRTPGQRAACRAVVSARPGSTLVAMLPTGSGKTEVALTLADSRPDSVTLIIVPTVALAYDFERRFRDHYRRRNPRVDWSQQPFAWTAETGEADRGLIRSRITSGIQRVLVTSPESMTRALRITLIEAAAMGRLGGFVIDEAHLVSHWGRAFRPEFRTLADLRTDLVNRAMIVGHPAPVTLLLSATLGAYELRDLHTLFARPGPCALVAANALRAEPEIWIGVAASQDERERWVLDALDHLPRPLALYVTRPETAVSWERRLRERGYERLAVVTGESSVASRQNVLSGLRPGADGSPSSIDLVIATSAFGLGIDYPHLRAVVHACLPETVDRWYQEIGRGGRDGHVSAALLLTHLDTDLGEAYGLGLKSLKPTTARTRWLDLWQHRREKEAGRTVFLDLEGSTGSARRGSYNRRWNAHIVQGLVELGVVERRQIDADDIRDLTGAGDAVSDWAAVEMIRPDHDSHEFWNERWEPWRQTEMARSREMTGAMDKLARQATPACTAIAACYEPDRYVEELFGPAVDTAGMADGCGRCPGCRHAGTPRPAEPLPVPMQAWPIGDEYAADLVALSAAAGAVDDLILLHHPDPAEIAGALAAALVRRGVRHLAGRRQPLPDGPSWLFVDPDPLTPYGLTPCSSFVVYDRGLSIPPTWLNARLRNRVRNFSTVRTYDVLLAPTGARIGTAEIGRDRHALAATTALRLLGG